MFGSQVRLLYPLIFLLWTHAEDVVGFTEFVRNLSNGVGPFLYGRPTKSAAISARTVAGPSPETKPDYENISGPLGKEVDRVFLKMFRDRLAENIGVDSSLPQVRKSMKLWNPMKRKPKLTFCGRHSKDDYQGIIELAEAMNARFSDRQMIQKIAQDTLRTLNVGAKGQATTMRLSHDFL